MIQVENNLPDTSRVWVYQSNRSFSTSEMEELQSELLQFNVTWEAHSKKLNSAIEVFYNQFIVIFVDETTQEATGCSIDKSVTLVKSLEEKYNIDLLDRMNLTYKEGDLIQNIKMGDFQSKAQSGEIDSSVIVFNNLVNSKAEFLTNWETQASKSWHNNLF